MSLANLTTILEQSNDDLVAVFDVVRDIDRNLSSYIIKKEQGVFDKKNFEFQQAQLNISTQMLRALRDSTSPTSNGDDLEAKRDQKDFNERLLKAIQNQSGGKSVSKNYKGNSFGGSMGGALAGGVAIAGKGIGAAVALGSLGLGIGGFFAGIAAGDKLGSMFNTDFSTVKKGMKSLGEALTETPNEGLLKMGALAAVGAKFGSLKGAMSMTFFGAGIGGFFAGLALGDKAGAMMGADGSNLKAQMTNFAEGIAAFDDRALLALGGLLAIGGVMGGSAVSAAAGMTALGAGIGGFFSALAGIGELAGALGVDGGGINVIMTNIADGMNKLAAIDYANLLGLIPAMLGLGPAMLVLLGSDGLSSIGDAVMGFFGVGKEGDDIFSKVAKGLQKLEILDVKKLSGLTEVANSVRDLSQGLSNLEDIDFGDVRDQLQELGDMMAWAAPMFKEIDYSGINEASKMGTGIFETVQQNHDAIMATRPNKGQTLTDQTKQMQDNANKPTPIIVSAPTQQTNNVSNNSTAVMGNGNMSMTDSFDMGTRDW
jgi:hypothetical protein